MENEEKELSKKKHRVLVYKSYPWCQLSFTKNKNKNKKGKGVKKEETQQSTIA